MLITIDPYYSVVDYNIALQAMKNNGVSYKEFISIKTPYNWYLDVPSAPIMTNYDDIQKGQKRWLVSVVQPLRPNEEYLYARRNDDKGSKALGRFILNEPLKEAENSQWAAWITVSNREEAISISKQIPVKIWYFGKYMKGRYRLCLVTNPLVRNFIKPSQILLEKTPQMNEMGRFEAELNYKVFLNTDYLKKATETPYFLEGQYYPVKIMAGSQSNMN